MDSTLDDKFNNNMYNVPDNRSTSKMLELKESGGLDGLTPRERVMVESRFGLYGGPPKTLEAIGKEHHIGRERVRQIITESLEKIGVDPWE